MIAKISIFFSFLSPVAVALLTASTMATVGVSPPSDREAHTSTLFAPPAAAATAEDRLSMQTSIGIGDNERGY
jgi:hypothetical protein